MSKQKNTLTPHDNFFKRSLKNPQTAKHLLMQHLPEKALAMVNLDTLKLCNVEFIDEDLKKSACDVVFRVQTIDNKVAYIYTLIEHQRMPDKQMPYRLLKYVIRLMDTHLIEHNTDELPLVLPLVIYNGDQVYPHSMDLFDLFPSAAREQARNTLVAPYPLIDLNLVDTAETKNAWLSLLFNTLKYGPSKATPEKVVNILSVAIIDLARVGDVDAIQNSLRYLFEVKDKQSRQSLLREFQVLLQPVLGENFMISIADDLRQEGMHLAKLEAAREMLLEGIDLDKVARITKLSLDEIGAEVIKAKSDQSIRH